jgi:hypothetical protein
VSSGRSSALALRRKNSVVPSGRNARVEPYIACRSALSIRRSHEWKKGLVRSRVEESSVGRGGNRRSYYRITALGEKRLAAYIERTGAVKSADNLRKGKLSAQLLIACADRPKLWLTALLAWLARAISGRGDVRPRCDGRRVGDRPRGCSSS